MHLTDLLKGLKKRHYNYCSLGVQISMLVRWYLEFFCTWFTALNSCCNLDEFDSPCLKSLVLDNCDGSVADIKLRKAK